MKNLKFASASQLVDSLNGFDKSLSTIERHHMEAIADAKRIGAQATTYTPATLQEKLDNSIKAKADAVEREATAALTAGEAVLEQERFWTPEAVLRRATITDDPAIEPATRATLLEELRAADGTEFLARVEEFVQTGNGAGIYIASLALVGRPDGTQDVVRLPVTKAKFDFVAADPEVGRAKETFQQIKSVLSSIRNLQAIFRQTATLAQWLQRADALDKRATLVRPGRLS